MIVEQGTSFKKHCTADPGSEKLLLLTFPWTGQVLKYPDPKIIKVQYVYTYKEVEKG